MVCFTCQHLHTAKGKLSPILLCKKITTRARGGVLSIFLHSEQLHKYLKTLLSYEGKNVSSFFQYSERQHETFPKLSRIQVPALNKKQKQTKKISKHHEG